MNEISRNLKRMKIEVEDAERYYRNRRREITELQRRVERVPNESPLSQVYEPENMDFSPSGRNRVVVVVSAADNGQRETGDRPAVVEARDRDHAPSYAPLLPEEPEPLPTRRAFCGHVVRRPANMGNRPQPSSKDKEKQE